MEGPCCVGVDFTCAPSRRKPVQCAFGRVDGATVTLLGLVPHDTLDGLARWLRSPGDWVGAFDMPLGLPRELVRSLGWPMRWHALMQHYAALPRDEIRARFKAFCDARPPGTKFAHRACDGPAGSSPSMKWVNPPVAWMLHAGVPLLLDAGVHLPGLHDGDRRRVALEGYPALLAREAVGRRSYKSDAAARQTDERRAARAVIVDMLKGGRHRLGLSLQLTPAQARSLVDDARADRLDAVLCMLQAAWATTRPDFGLPPQRDALEGWIVTAPWVQGCATVHANPSSIDPEHDR